VRKTLSMLSAAAIVSIAGFSSRVGVADVDAAIPEYKSSGGVSGDLAGVGSDTLNEAMTYWCSGFQEIYSNVNPTYDPKGSGAAPTALIEGTAVVGPMSREMKADEIQKFEKKFGYKPTAIRVCLDALAVFVQKDNPIQSLTLKQVDAMFSSTRKRGAPADLTSWGQVGLTGEWAALPISLYGRNSTSGTYGYFKEHVLSKGDYKTTVKEQQGSSAVVNGIKADRAGIGYSGIGYRTPDVRAVPIAADDGKPYEASEANVYANTYPISRPLFVYVNKGPGQPLQPLVREFLLFVLSKQGQELVKTKAGFVALTSQMVSEERAKLN
jgi:phosphate transport system substrate-binding protein